MLTQWRSTLAVLLSGGAWGVGDGLDLLRQGLW
jgi:hypothetical protein